MPRIHSVACRTPAHYYDQETIIAALRARWAKDFFNFERVEAMLRHALVGGRHLAAKIEEYPDIKGWQQRNEIWLATALALATEVCGSVLETAGIAPDEISLLASATVTGLAIPSLEARLMNQIRFAPNTKRLPIFGLGCLAGAAGIHRVADYLRAYPKEAALFVSVELCSLTWQGSDLSVANVVSSGLFGDGCAVVLLVGDEHPLADQAHLALVDWQSWLFPKTEAVMGFDVTDAGFKVVLSPEVPAFAAQHLEPVLTGFLAGRALERRDLAFHIAHPGGPRVLDALENVLLLPPGGLALSRASLQQYGNMSSVSVLFVLADFLRAAQATVPRSGAHGLLAAMGPGFSAELGLLRWEA